MSSAMMSAAYIRALGPASGIRVGALPVPEPGPTDVLIAVDAVAVNPVDTYVRAGLYQTRIPMPFIVGRDAVGTVATVGSNALPFRQGDRVWCNSMGHDGRQGTFAEFAIVPADRLYSLPDDVDPHTAVAVAHPAATAYLAWFVHGLLQPRETVYVAGGAGNVGTAAIHMAALAGARVLTSARPEDHDRCRANGADFVLDYRDPRLGERLAELAPTGVDIYWDTSGSNDLTLAVETTAVGGRILVTAAGDGEATLRMPSMYTRDLSLHGFVISRANVAELAAAATLINRMLAEHRLTPRIADTLPLTRTAEAHQRVEAGVSGRLLVQPTGNPMCDTRQARH